MRRYRLRANSSAACPAIMAAVLGGCAAPAPQADAWVAPAVGLTWEIAQRNTGSYGKDVQYTVTRGDTQWNGAPAVALKFSTGPTIVAEPAGGRFLAILGGDGRPMLSYDPPIGWDYPLYVGKGWSVHERMTMHAAGKVVEFDLHCKVEGFERVTVPAGSFDAFRVHCTNTIGSDETYWTSPGLGSFVKTQLRRDASNPFGAGTQESMLVRRPAPARSTAAN